MERSLEQEQTVLKLTLASPGDVLMDAAKRYRVDTEKLQKAVACERPVLLYAAERLYLFGARPQGIPESF